MIVHSIFFYFFSVIAIFSSLMVITSRSTINSVFFLILDFISVGCLFIMVGAEFLGMILLIVYVGAVAVLFLFVVMMLNVAEQKQSWFIGKKSTHIPTGLSVSQQDEKSQHKNKAKGMKILRARLYELERSRIDQERSQDRKTKIGTGDRSERIRTYNFPQGRVTDHRINLTLHKLEEFLEGEAFDEMIESLTLQAQEESLGNLK